MIAVLAFFPVAVCFAQAKQAGQVVVDEQGYTVRSRVDWAAGTLEVEVSHLLDASTASLPRAKSDAETDVQSRLQGFLVSSISPITVDSSHTYGDLLRNDPSLFTRVSARAAGAQEAGSSLSDDFSRLIARYSLPLFGAQGVASPLFQSRSVLIPRMLGWVPTRPFTGLLIYAKGMLPEVGTSRSIAARPALFPRIFDEEMTLVMERAMCSPEALGRWGMVGYAASLDDPVVVLRAGQLPLRLVARGVFGDKSTDIVIPSDGARQLLTLAENRELLRDGRIVIVYDSLD